jgi:hypothetical protein
MVMRWVLPWSRRSAELKRIDEDDDDEHLVNGFICDAEIRAFTMGCPACGALHQITTHSRQSRVFDHRKQRFRCSRCRFQAPVHVIVDCGLAPDEPERLNTQ